MNRRAVKPVVRNFVKFPVILNDAAASSSERERWSDNRRKSDFVMHKINRVLIIRHDLRGNARFSNRLHRVLKKLAVFRLVNRLRLRAQKLHAVALQKSRFRKFH